MATDILGLVLIELLCLTF